MKVKGVISVINNTDYYSLISAQRAAGLCKEDLIVENYNFSKHKNFDIATNIYKCEDGFVGISGLKNDHSKSGFDQYNITTWVEEYVEIPTVTYAPKYRKR